MELWQTLSIRVVLVLRLASVLRNAKDLCRIRDHDRGLSDCATFPWRSVRRCSHVTTIFIAAGV
jgi:hypothetical protein